MSISRKVKILVCPLDWGLGHATRCIPLIRELNKYNSEVIIAADGHSAELLKKEFPELTHIHLKGYGIKFSKYLPASTGMVFSIPFLLRRAYKEHTDIRNIIQMYNIDVLISDNRYGLWNKNVYSIFLTHQLNIIPPTWLNYTSVLLRKITRYFIEKFNECWIPDIESNPSLSGDLSHKGNIPYNAVYIGYLSRFDNPCQVSENTYDIIAILSGPEPHRSELEKLLIKQLSEFQKRSLILRGVTGTNNEISRINNLTIIDHMPSEELCSLLTNKPVVICRGGYSTLMDMAHTGNKIICIPTPGQTEQEYLATYGASMNWFINIRQKEFILKQALQKLNETTGIPLKANSHGYKYHVQRLIGQFNKS